MTTAVLALNRVQKNLQARIYSVNLPAVNWKVVCCAGFFISLAMLVFYVWQVNTLTHGTYLINSFENQISKLSEENKNLAVSFEESSFMGQALSKMQALNFQGATSLKYIHILDNSVQLTLENKNL